MAIEPKPINITVDLTRPGIVNTQKEMRYGDKNLLTVEVTRGGEVIDLSTIGAVTTDLVVKRLGSTNKDVLGSIVDGKAVFTVDGDSLAKPGRTEAVIQFYDADGARISTATFAFTTLADPSLTAVGDVVEQTIIQQVLVDGPQVIADAEEKIVELDTVIDQNYFNFIGDVATRSAIPVESEREFGDAWFVIDEGATVRWNGTALELRNTNNPSQIQNLSVQLAGKVNLDYLETKLDSPKVPLKLTRIPSFASGETMFNSTSYVQDNLTTFANNQYVIFTDQERRPVVGKRKLPDGEWSFFVLSTLLNNNLRSPTQLDEHNVYSIAVDKTGHIHICGNMHATVINYVRSKYPENIGEWEGTPGGYMTGIDEDIASYPHFVKRKDGELLFFYRNGSSTNAITSVNIYNTSTKTWSKLVSVLTAVTDGQTIDNPYFNRIAVDKDGTIHFSGCFRMNGYNADIFYMKSTDGGATWKKSNGTPQTLPMTHANAEIAKQIDGSGNGLLNQNGMEVDEDGNPHTVYFRKDSNGYTNIFHLYHNGTSWIEKQITNLKKTLSSDLVSWSGEMSRPSIFTVGKRVFIVYRVNYEGKNGTVRMIEVTPTLLSPVEFPILNIDLYAWEPTFDTQALYEKNELHMLITPCTTDYARYNNLTQLDNWKEQFLGVLSLDLNQIDKVIRKEVVLPEMRLVRSIAGGNWSNASATGGAFSFNYPQIPMENTNGEILFAKLSVRARGYNDTKFYIRVKDVRLPSGNVSSYNSVLFDTASSTNKESTIRPLSTYNGMRLIEIEGFVELLNGATNTNIAVSSVTLDIYKIVY